MASAFWTLTILGKASLFSGGWRSFAFYFEPEKRFIKRQGLKLPVDTITDVLDTLFGPNFSG